MTTGKTESLGVATAADRKYWAGVDYEDLLVTARRVRDAFAKITYKPGWVFDVQADPSFEVMIVVNFPVRDITKEGYPETTLQFRRSFSVWCISGLSFDSLLSHVVMGTIRQIEEHEFQEWFKVDGVCIYDPHPELKKEARHAR
jgi:hypothetical protein